MTESTVVSMQCFPHGLPLIQTHRSTHRSIGISVLIAWQQARLLWKENDRNRHRSNHYDMGARHPQFDEFFMSQPRRGMDDLQNQSSSNIPIWIKHGVDANFIRAAATFLPPDKLVFGPLVSSRSCAQFRSLAEENVAMWNSAGTSIICDHPRRNNKFMGAASSCRNNPCFAHLCGCHRFLSCFVYLVCTDVPTVFVCVSIYIRSRGLPLQNCSCLLSF